MPIETATTKVYQLSELRDAEYNVNVLEDLDGLKTSIETFGLVELPVVNTYGPRRGVIVGGVHRIKVLRAAGETEVQCIEVHLEPEQERQLNLRLNKHRGKPSADLVAEFFEAAELVAAGFTEADLAGFDMLEGIDVADDLWAAATVPEAPAEAPAETEESPATLLPTGEPQSAPQSEAAPPPQAPRRELPPPPTGIDFRHCSAEELLPTLAEDSVDLVLVDPPYFREVSEDWDRQWANEVEFLEWMAGMCSEWQRVLRPNGSLYCFASPSMHRQVANVIAGELRWCPSCSCRVGGFTGALCDACSSKLMGFEVLSLIRWNKPTAIADKASPEQQRRYITGWEACIFAEQPGADSTARGESGYASALDEARGIVFEPLRAYFVAERERWGGSNEQIYEALNSSSPSHYFTQSQWALPTEEKYHQLRELFGAVALTREYGALTREYGALTREYDDLKAEYEHRRRPFSVEHGARNRSDLWSYSVTGRDPDRHPCEKPLDMLRDIMVASTRPGAVVLDCFSGRASTACACIDTGREFIGCERDEGWHYKGLDRIDRHPPQISRPTA